jgi:hypothetical protein
MHTQRSLLPNPAAALGVTNPIVRRGDHLGQAGRSRCRRSACPLCAGANTNAIVRAESARRSKLVAGVP